MYSSFIVFSQIIALQQTQTGLLTALNLFSFYFTTLQTTFAQCVRLFLIFETAFVETSLLRVGMWVNSPSILREIATKGASTSELPKYRKATNRNHCYPSSLVPEITSKEVEMKEGK